MPEMYLWLLLDLTGLTSKDRGMERGREGKENKGVKGRREGKWETWERVILLNFYLPTSSLGTYSCHYCYCLLCSMRSCCLMMSMSSAVRIVVFHFKSNWIVDLLFEISNWVECLPFSSNKLSPFAATIVGRIGDNFGEWVAILVTCIYKTATIGTRDGSNLFHSWRP